jgi:hypothetical protein
MKIITGQQVVFSSKSQSPLFRLGWYSRMSKAQFVFPIPSIFERVQFIDDKVVTSSYNKKHVHLVHAKLDSADCQNADGKQVFKITW